MCGMKSTLVWLLAVPLLLGTLVLSQPTFSAAQTATDPQSHLSPGNAGARSSGGATNVYPIEQGYVDAHGEMIYYEIIGQGPPLMIVHGGPGASHDYFLPYLLPLARHNKLVFIDERGSGRSQKLDEPSGYTVENMVKDVEDVRRELDLGKISLLGHSYGGVLAEAYALKYQQNLTHLVLASTFPSTKEMNEVFVMQKQKMPAQVRENIDKLEAQGLFWHGKPWERNRYTVGYMNAAWGDGYFPYLYGRHPDPNYDPVAQGVTSWDLYREMWGSNGEFVIEGNMKSVEYVDLLPTIKVPTLVIAGDHDECDPSLSRQMNQKIAGSKLVILPDSGHMTFVDQPIQFNRAVGEFLQSK